MAILQFQHSRVLFQGLPGSHVDLQWIRPCLCPLRGYFYLHAVTVNYQRSTMNYQDFYINIFIYLIQR